jgi:hypothetical protein
MNKTFTPSIHSVVAPTSLATDRHHPLTVSAIAVIVYSLASVLHEGVGHGGACLLVRGIPLEMSSMHFNCSLPESATAAERIVAASGTLVTLLGGFLSLALYRIVRLAAPVRYMCWLFAAVNILQGTGYFFFSGVGGVGDWAVVMQGVGPSWLWRIVFAGVGFAAYYWFTLLLFAELDPFIGKARPRKYEHALRLAGRAYVVGGVVELLAGLLNPGGMELVLYSGIAASLGGTSGLVWGPQTLRGTRTPSSDLEKPVLIVRQNWIVITLGIIIGIAFIIGLGPGIPLGNG